ARLLQHADVHAIAIGPLDLAAASALVEAELGTPAPDELVRACHEVTGGNPFLLHELAGELRRSRARAKTPGPRVRKLAPPAIVRSVRLRLEGLAGPAVALAQAVAVLGDGAALPEAAELAGLGGDAAIAAAEALADADILQRGRPLAFVHAVVA